MPIGGIEWDGASGVLKAIHAWVVAGSGLAEDKVVFGGQAGQRPEAPAIIMRISNISDVGTMWLDYEANPHTFDDIVVTADAATDLLSAVGHDRLTGDGPVRFTTTGTFPTASGGDINGDTDYWVVKVDDDTFKVARNFQNAMASTPMTIDLTSAGTGTLSLVDTSETVRQGQELKATSRGLVRATLELRCHAERVVGSNMAVAILQRISTRREWPSQQDILEAANVALQDIDRIISITTGTQDDFLHEPRAVLLVHLCMAVEESEYVTIIDFVQATNEIPEPDVEFTVP